jgi:hypothetical protein
VLTIEPVEVPLPRPEEALIRHTASGLRVFRLAWQFLATMKSRCHLKASPLRLRRPLPAAVRPTRSGLELAHEIALA